MKYFIILLTFISLITLPSCKNGDQKREPVAAKGVIDISSWDFEKDGPLEIKGEWKFYWKTFLEPKDILGKSKKLSKSVFVNGPSAWKAYKDNDGNQITGLGYGTYVLKVKGGDNLKRDDLAFSLVNSGTAYRLYYFSSKKGAKPLISNGVVGINKEKHIAQFLPKISNELKPSRESYLVMQVSNFSDANGGMWSAPKLGKKSDLIAMRTYDAKVGYFLLGVLIIIAIYHFGLFMQRREDVASLFFAIYCVLISFRMAITEKFFHMLADFPSNIVFELLYKLEFLTVYLSVPVFYNFYLLVFPRETSARVNPLR